ncbi:anti-repressor SinI family protein [Bacillus sp. UNC41MFS5]|nr:anti-repressor SinI family protein [Bacillus sp. UNC41MFS5]
MITITNENELDEEWMELIKKAREIGITIEEISYFLNNSTS